MDFFLKTDFFRLFTLNQPIKSHITIYHRVYEQINIKFTHKMNTFFKTQ